MCVNVNYPVVEKGDKETLFKIIREFIRPGTTIISDRWKVYGSLQFIGFTVKHFHPKILKQDHVQIL